MLIVFLFVPLFSVLRCLLIFCLIQSSRYSIVSLLFCVNTVLLYQEFCILYFSLDSLNYSLLYHIFLFIFPFSFTAVAALSSCFILFLNRVLIFSLHLRHVFFGVHMSM